MAITLSQLKPAKGSRHRTKRVGRGNASGHGTYSTRGLKGQRARSGSRKGLKQKGMKARLLTIPKKRGFTSPYPKHQVVNVGQLNRFADGAVVTRKLLAKEELIAAANVPTKILANGELTKKLTVKECDVSAAAKTKIESVGGTVVA